jgi:membrane protease YdiL (CAAX protease family)
VEFLAAATAASEQLDWTDFAWIAFAIAVFAYVVRRVLQENGDAVDVSHYGNTETAVAGLLTCLFVLEGTMQFVYTATAEDKVPITAQNLLTYEAMVVAFMCAVLLIVKSRGASLHLLFGLGRQPIWKAVILALVLIFAAYPIVAVGMLLTQGFSKGPEDIQEIVKFFRGAGGINERLAVVLSAVVIAPLSEELFFRGFIYGVAKKYCGLAAAVVFNAALFAFIHGSLQSFGGLFALAACLTLAYELSGSLYVPIIMHASFNAAELVLIYLGRGTPTP